MGAFDDLISKHSGSQSSGAFDDLVQKYGNQTPQKEGWGTTLKNFGNAASSGLGQFVVDTQSGVANFLQAPSANMLSGVKSGIALFDSGLTDLINASGGEAAIHKETLEDAQRASAFAAETRAENVKNNVIARGLKFLEDDGRERKAEIKADDERVNPEQIRQQEAVSNAEGLIEKSKALLKNPLAFTNTLSESLPGIVLGLGAGRLVASRTLSAGAGAGEAAAARVAAAGGDVAAQEIAAKTAIQAVQAQATRAASTAGIASEAGISGLSSRESTYTQVKQTPLAKLAESKRYQEIFDQTGNSEQAREILANEVADSTPLLSAGLTGLGTVITNKLYGGDATAKVLAGVEKPTLKAVAKDISQEGVEEVVQGIPQGFSDHTAMQIADPTKQFDLGGEIAQNFLGGIALGGAGHGSAYAKQKFNDARSGVADAIKSRYEEQLAEKLTGKTAPEVTDTYEPSAPKLNEAEKALATPNSITPLDRVQEIDMRLNKLSPENGYGETFDAERNDLQQERNAITQAFPKIVSGAPTSFSTEAGAKLDAQYALIEAGDLQTSHDENLRANPNYPAALQPRERDRASSATQIAGIVQKIDPARLGISADAATGAPIIGADGLVESGNARSIALKRIYRVPGQKAEDYKAYLTANAAQFGLDPAQIGALEKPVLVRVRNTPVDRAEFARQANASTVARMSSVEQARADAKRLDVLDDLNPTENGDFSNSHDFIRRFLSKTPQTEHGDLIDSDGRLSSSGYARVRNAVLAKAYGDSPVILRLTESLDDNLRNVSKALLQVAPKVAQVRASIGEGNLHDADITPDLLGAVEELSRIKDKGQSVGQYLGQSGIFDDKLTPEGKELLQFLDENIRRPKQMAEFILRYTEALEAQGNPSQADIFGDNTAPTKGELLNVAKREQNVEPIAGQGRNQESEVPTGQAGIEREDTRGSQEGNQGNDAATRGEGEGGFVNFPEDSGTLGIPRKEMPQIKGEARGGLISFLAARGINHETGTVKASSLKPTQAEYSPAKVDKFVETGAIGGRSVLVSSDGHVLDGHHQWLGHKERGENINVIRFDKPMKELLPVVNEFPSVKRSDSGSNKQAMIDGRPYDTKRDNFNPPATDNFIPVATLSKTRKIIDRLLKSADVVEISDANRVRAEKELAPLIKLASDSKPAFDQKIIDIAKSTGALGQMLTSPKRLESATQKFVNEVNFDISKMFDMLRSTIVVGNYDDAQNVINAIRNQFEIVPGRIKNMTDAKIDGKQGTFIPSGYGQVLVNVKMPSGVIAEIQINIPEMLAVKSAEGHKLYEIERTAQEGSKTKAEAIAAQQEIYPLAAAAAAARNDDSLEPFDPNDPGKLRNGVKYNNPVVSLNPNTLPSGNLTNSVASPLVPNSQPSGKDLGTSISSPPANSVAEGKDEVKDDEAVFKANSTAVLGLTVDALTSQVKAITDQWKNAPKTNVLESPSELPFAAPSDARGAYYKGQIYLVASNLRSQEDAQMVLFHEALGHAGLRGAFGESLTPSLRKLAIDNLSIAKAAAEWRKENSDIRGKKTEDLWLTTSVEEVLADIAGQGKPLKGFDQFLAKVQSGLRAIGLNHVADWLSKHTNAEVLRLLTAARKHIIAGNKSHVFGKDEAKAFSIDPDADKSAEAALEEISKIGDAFAYPKSESNTVEGITADIDSSINVRKLTNIRGETRYEFSMPDGSTARMMVRPFNKYGKSVYGFELDASNEMTGQADERPGKFPEEAHGKGDVWIDVSLLKEGKGYGAKLYQIAANYAHNTDQVFIGDPAGISREALIRRPEQMLSSALKFGTTEHLAPHPMQIKGDKKNGIAPLDWVYGDHVGNIQKLIDANLQNIDNGGGIGGIEYDKRTGEFIDGAGTGITRQDLFGLAEAGLARSVQAGGRTLARYAFLKSILPAHRSGERARRESGALLVRLSQQLRDHVSTLAQNVGADPKGKAIFYSRGRDGGELTQATNEQEALSHVGTVAERANAIIQKSAATPAPIEAVVKAAVKLTQFDKLTSAIYDGAGFILDRFTPETVKAGFVSDYGVPEAVIDRRTTLSAHMNVQTRKAGKLIDQLASLTREESRVAYEWMNNSNPEALKHFEEQLPPESVAVLADVKKMIDDLSKEAISLGQLSKEAYDKNSMEYLRRSYEKHIVGIDKKEQKARTRALSILGDQYKGRGLVELASMKQIQNLAPDWWNRKLVDGKADKQLKGEKFIRLERHAPSGEGTIPLEGLGDKQKGKLQEIVYYPAGEAIPAKYAEWTEAGTFEVRDTKGGDAVLWRDFTKQEREKMGEIDEARFAIAKTLHGMIHDVEVGRYLEWVNRKYGLTHKEQVPGEIINAHELTLTTFGAVYKPGDWVKVPKTEIGETGVYKYGALAGKFIPGPIWNDVRQIGTGSFMPFGPTYSAILRLWKTSKTALSTGVHMNNIMSNFVMADWHDVSAGHIHKALRILLASHDREGTGIIGKAGNAAARLGIVDREAAKEILGRYQDSGGNIGTYASKELQNEQIQPLLDAIEREMAENGESPTAQVGVMNALQFLRHGEVSAAYQAAIGSKGAKAVGNEAKNLLDLYQSEDDVFRLAAWLKAKEDGATDIEAGKKSRKSFLDYNINAPWVAAMRSTAFPFIAFSYRAIPMLAETAAKRPWKLLKLAAIAGGLNALSYALIGGDEDDERRYLPEEKAGRVWGMVPKLIRMPFDTDGQPVFLDIRRFIPVGDVFDLGQGHSAVPVPPSMMPGGPMMLLFEAILNKSAFTAKDISLETDTTFERLMKTGDYMYKAVAPNIAFLPGTYSYENITNAGKGKTDTFGRELSINQALLNSIGIKVGSYGSDILRYNAGKKLDRDLLEIDGNIKALGREYSKKGLTYDEFIEKATKQQDKKKAIIEKYRAK